jgi:hypothetical protein
VLAGRETRRKVFSLNRLLASAEVNVTPIKQATFIKVASNADSGM